MRICRIAEAFPPPWSGLAPGVYDLSIAQARKIDLTVIAKKSHPEPSYINEDLPFHLIRLSGRSLLWDINALLEFLKLNKQKPFDLLHVHGGGAVLTTVFLSVFTNISIASSVHCVRKKQFEALRVYNEYKYAKQVLSKGLLKRKLSKSWRYRKWLNPEIIREEIAFKAVDKLLCVNPVLINYIIDSYSLNANMLFTILNGVNFNEFKSTFNNETQIGSNRILFVGRIIGGKDLSPILFALSKLKTTFPKIELIVAGDGDFRRYLEEVVAYLNLTHNVHFLNNISKEQLICEYQKATAFILPSVSEGLPKVLLEAMSCSKPVIVSDIPQHQFIIKNGKNGYLIQMDDINGWVTAIRNIFENDTLAKEMGANNRRLIEKEYSWDNVAERCLKAYKSILREK